MAAEPRPGTESAEYAERLTRLQTAWWKRVLDVQRPYRRHLQHYQADPKAAADLLRVGYRPDPKDADRATLAAWTSVARVLLNLHETITRN